MAGKMRVFLLWTFSFFLFLLGVAGDDCPREVGSPPTLLPRTDQPSTFLLTGRPFPCASEISAFAYYPVVLSPFFIAIWRPVSNDKYTLMNKIKILPSDYGPQTNQLDAKWNVRAGDVIGVHYATASSAVVVPRATMDDIDSEPAQMYTIKMANKFDSEYSIGGLVDFSGVTNFTGMVSLRAELTGNTCSDNTGRIPSRLPRAETNRLHLLTDYRFTCDSHVVGWNYYAVSSKEVFIGVWRTEGHVGYTLVKKTKLNPSQAGGNMSLTLPEPIAVKAGDFIGVHYQESQKDPVIPCALDEDNVLPRSELIRIVSAEMYDETLADGTTIHPDFLYNQLGTFAVQAVMNNEVIVNPTPGTPTLSNTDNYYMLSTNGEARHGTTWLHVEGSTLAFSVKTCENARVLLFSIQNHTRQDYYEIVLGTDYNSRSYIHAWQAEPGKLHYVDTPNILDCNADVLFWLSWDQGEVKVGKGSVLGQNVFMSWRDPNGVQAVNAISMATGSGMDGLWKFYKHQGRILSHWMKPSTSAGSLLVDVQSQHYIKIQVKACQNVSVILTQKAQQMKMYYQIVIGRNDNKQSELWAHYSDVYVSKAETPGVLDCNEYRLFWISWRGGYLEFGQGASLYEDRLLRTLYNNPSWRVGAVTFKPSGQQGAEVLLRGDDDDLIAFIPAPLTDEQPWSNYLTVPDQRYFTFSAKTCSDIEIALWPNLAMNKTMLYLIKLKNFITDEYSQVLAYPNTEPVIVSQAITPRLLNCHTYRDFWVSWRSDMIKVGQGRNTFNKTFLAGDSGMTVRGYIPVHSMSFRTSKADSCLQIQIPYQEAQFFSTKTLRNSVSSMLWRTIESKTTFTFSVKACRNAQVLLTKYPGISTTEAVEMNIGDLSTGEMTTNFRKRSPDSPGPSVKTPNILSCSVHRKFWIQWTKGIIEMGRGPVPKTDSFISWNHGDADFQVKGIAMTTPKDADGEWQMEHGPDMYTVSTAGGSGEDISPACLITDKQFAALEIKSCNDAVVTLTTGPTVKSPSYAVTFGANGNNGIVITAESGEILGELVLPNTLSCDVYRKYWLGWWRGFLRVGRGVPIENELYAIPIPRDQSQLLTSLMFRSKAGAAAQWRFSHNSGRIVKVNTATMTTGMGQNVSLTVQDEDALLFTVRACGNAKLQLDPTDHRLQGQGRQLVIGTLSGMNSTLLYDDTGKVLVNQSTPGIVGCQRDQAFWLSWREYTLRFGTGADVGQKQVLSLRDPQGAPQMYRVQAVNVEDYPAVWNFYRQTDEYQVNTLEDTAHASAWITAVSYSPHFDFKVQACNSVTITLHNTPGRTEYMYRILIGEEDNRWTRIRDSLGNIKMEVETPDILSCRSAKSFWMSWELGELKVGQGSRPQGRIIALVNPNIDITSIHAIQISTQNNVKGEWFFSKRPNQLLRVSTPDETVFNRLWLSVQRQKYVTFTVLACADVNVALAETSGVLSQNAYIITIGALGNTVSRVRRGINGEIVYSTPTERILRCTKTQSFWILWDEAGLVQVGQGALPEKQTFIYYRDNSYPISIKALSIAGGPNSQIDWVFGQDEGNSNMVKTPPEYGYNSFWFTPKVTLFQFKVRACSDAHIALSRAPWHTEGKLYEITIGAEQNTKSIIRTKAQNETRAENITNGILSCTEYKQFWISWMDGHIQFGEGYAFNDVKVEWSDSSPYIVNSVGLGSSGTLGADWIFLQGNELGISTKSKKYRDDRRFTLDVAGRDHMVFQVQACTEAHVKLEGYPGNDNAYDNMYEVVIGFKKNTRTGIRRNPGEPFSVSVSTPDILSCTEQRAFWVAWQDGWVAVGRGALPYENLITSDFDYNPHAIRALTFDNHFLDDGMFEFFSYEGNNFRLTTTSWDHLDRSSVVPVNESFHFSVQSCKDAHVALRGKLYTGEDVTYEIGLGLYDNTRTVIRELNSTEPYVLQVTPGILSCDLQRSFVIGWAGSRIWLSSGQSQQYRLAEWQNSQVFTVTAVSMATTSRGHWSIPQVSGEVFRVKSPSFISYETATIDLQGLHTYSFKVQACQHVIVDLSAIPYRTSTLTYEFIIGYNENKKSELRVFKENFQAVSVIRRDSPDLLNCGEVREFWVSWKNGTIALGKHSTPGQDIIISWQDPNPHNINAFTMTSTTTEAMWEFVPQTDIKQQQPPVQDDVEYRVKTPARHSHDLVWILTDRQTFTFSVMACSQAHIALSSVPNNSSALQYDIIIGTSRNTKSVITNKISSGPLAQNNTPGILDCASYREFWVSHMDGMIQVGRGLVVGQELFLSWQDTNKYKIKALSLSTDAGIEGYWKFFSDAGRIIRTYLSSDSYNDLWVQATEDQRQVIHVQSCMDARILVASEPYQSQTGMEITLGGEQNRKSWIKSCPSCDSDSYPVAETPGILNCNESRPFWVSWKSTFLEVGKGANYGQAAIVRKQGPKEVTAKALSVKSGISSPGWWEFRTLPYKSVHLVTPNQRGLVEFWLMMPGMSVSLKVRSCENAVIVLPSASHDLSKPHYEIILGAQSNTRVQLMKTVNQTRTLILEVNAPGPVLHCDLYRKFWISWNSGKLRVGQGARARNIRLLEWNIEAGIGVQGVTFFSEANDGQAEWILTEDQGTEIEFSSPLESNYGYFWRTVEATEMSVVFQVKACKDAGINLSRYPGIPMYSSYEIVFGMNENRHTVLRKSLDEFTKVEELQADTPDILDCGRHVFLWISWKDGIIQAGRGYQPGNSIILSWKDPQPVQVGAMAVSASQDARANWIFGSAPGNEIYLYVDSLRGYNQAWMLMHKPLASFWLMACSDAKLLLADTPGNTNSDAYEITFGEQGNTQTVIRSVSQSESQMVTSNDVVACHDFSRFWVNCTNTSVILGKGDPYRQDVLLSWSPPRAHVCRSLAVASANENGAHWRFNRGDGVLTRVVTPDSSAVGRFRSVWASTLHETSSVFKIRACRNVEIALSQYRSLNSGLTYVVDVGTRNNSRVFIRQKETGGIVEEVATPNILSCTEFRAFWTSWQNGVIEFGKGRAIGSEVVARIVDPRPHPVNHIGFSSYNQSAEIELEEWKNDVYVYKSPPTIELSSMTLQTGLRRTFSFSVQACESARVILQGEPPNYYSFEFGIDGNQKTALKKNGNTMLEVLTPDLLDCYNRVRLWVRWDDGYFQAGKGKLNTNRLIDLKDNTTFSIQSVWMMTDMGVTGTWEFPKESADEVSLVTSSGFSYDQFWLTVSSRTDQTFQIRSCGEAKLALASVPGVTTMPTYEVVIGGEYNTMCAIRSGVNGTERFRIKTHALLSCSQFRSLWISWDRGQIRFGMGDVVGDFVLMVWNDPEPHDVGAISVSNDNGWTGLWKFSGGQGQRQIVRTPVDYSGVNYNMVWVSSPQNFFTFSVQSCRGARVLLANKPGNGQSAAYEVLIGPKDNFSRIYLLEDGTRTEEARVNTPNLLKCAVQREFWVSWKDNRLDVGAGPLNQGRFLSLNEPMRYPVHGVSMTTGNASSGEWMFPRNPDAMTVITVPDNYAYYYYRMSVVGFTYIVFKVQACGGAYIALSDTPGNYHDNAYEIGIGAKNNQETYICENMKSCNKHFVLTPNVLRCNESRPFWISWYRDRISVGKGPDVGWNELIAWSSPNPFPVVEVSMAAAGNGPGTYELTKLEGNMVTTFTSEDHSYDQVWVKVTQEYFRFRVKACKEAHILLTLENRNMTAYEIVLGRSGNMRSVIRNATQGMSRADVSTPQVLSCDQLRTFWVSWGGGNVVVGTGPVYTHVLMRWRDSAPKPVKYVSLSTGYGSGKGEWDFLEFLSEQLEVKTPDEYEYSIFWASVVGRQGVVFNVTACSSAHIALTSVPGVTNTLTYEVAIGTSGNTQTEIRQSAQGSRKVTQSTPQVLSCSEARPFWISWVGGRISVGHGTVLHQNMILVYQDPEPREVNALSVSSYYQVTGKWVFMPQSGSVPTQGPGSTTPPPIFTDSTGVPRSTVPVISTQKPPDIVVRSTTSWTGRKPPADAGLSTGQKLGISFGIISTFMIITIVVLMIVMRRKKGQSSRAPAKISNPNYELHGTRPGVKFGDTTVPNL